MRKVFKEIQIYQGKNGAIEFKSDTKKETVWATQAQVSELFEIERSVATKHIKNIFKDNELDENLVCAKFAHTASDGKTYNVQYYNLDIILSVGYRTNSVRAIQFRQWATRILKDHLTKGFTINKKAIQKNHQEFLEAIETVKKILPASSESMSLENTLDLVKLFADTWFSLDAYDKGDLSSKKLSKKKVELTAGELVLGVTELKRELLKKSEATEIFAQERSSGSLAGIVGNVMQSISGKSVYESVEEKAAHLLYFIVKNHPFVDGNKRTGAFSFVWFLQKQKLLNPSKLNSQALTSLTLLVAESDPKQKENIIKLIMKMIEK